MTDSKKRTENPKRFRAARSDASVGAMEREMEKKYNLPKGSVSIRSPDGKDVRSDAKVKTVRKKYD